MIVLLSVLDCIKLYFTVSVEVVGAPEIQVVEELIQSKKLE